MIWLPKHFTVAFSFSHFLFVYVVLFFLLFTVSAQVPQGQPRLWKPRPCAQPSWLRWFNMNSMFWRISSFKWWWTAKDFLCFKKSSNVFKKNHLKKKLHLTLGSPHIGRLSVRQGPNVDYSEKHIRNKMSFFEGLYVEMFLGPSYDYMTSSPTHKTLSHFMLQSDIRCCETPSTSFGHHTLKQRN